MPNESKSYYTCLAILLAAALTVIPNQASGAPIQWTSASGGNDHYYEVVNSANIDWNVAKAAAEGMFHLGMQGYLVTITSAAENAFITANFNTGDPGSWIGANDADSEGVWKWVTGPEAGTQFWSGAAGGSVTAPFNYANWSPGEPNNAGPGEDYAHIFFDLGPDKLGKWNDFSIGNDLADHYIVEYGAPVPEPATLLLLGTGLAGLGLIRRRRRELT